MRQQIVASARAGESVERTAERLLDVGNPIVRLPEHVEELRDAARRAGTEADGRDEFESVVSRWERRISRLGQGRDAGPGAFTMRSATQQLVTDLRNAREHEVDRIVDRWVLERARHQARIIARHETVEAHRDAYQQATQDQPGVVGYRWALSSLHPHADVCDIYAHQDLHGLGAGGYPAGQIPPTPHPSCLCTQTAIIDRFHMRRQLAIARGEPEPPREWESGERVTGAEWLAKQSEVYRLELLGKTRARLFNENPGRVLTARGEPIPVHQVLGRPAPSRRARPAVNARPLIQRDRATMVQPFPSAPTLAAGDDGRTARAEPTASAEPTFTAEQTLRGIVGFRGDPSSHEEHQVLRELFGDNVDPAHINQMLSLPEGFRAQAIMAQLSGIPGQNGVSLYIAATIETNDGTRVGRIARNLTRTDGRLTVEHSILKLGDEYQGKGIGSHILRAQFRSYMALGVRDIRLSTAWAGSYVWAKMGFEWDATTAGEMRTGLTRHLVAHQGLSSGEADAIARQVATDPQRLAALEVNGVHVGQDFLLAGPGWEGQVDLSPDSRSGTRYIRAIGISDAEAAEARARRARRR